MRGLLSFLGISCDPGDSFKDKNHRQKVQGETKALAWFLFVSSKAYHKTTLISTLHLLAIKIEYLPYI